MSATRYGCRSLVIPVAPKYSEFDRGDLLIRRNLDVWLRDLPRFICTSPMSSELQAVFTRTAAFTEEHFLAKSALSVTI
jgi:hypothetical protein